MIEHRDCATIDDMLPAYAVDGLDEADRALLDLHLLSCDRHDDAGLWRDVALRLADLVPAVAPPPGLRARILGIPHAVAEPAVTVDVVTQNSSGPEPRVESADPAAISNRPSTVPIPARRFPPYALAAVFAVLTVFFSGWTAVLLTGGGDDVSIALVASAAEGGIEASAAFIANEQVALVRFSGLTPLLDGSDYQLWAIGPGEDPKPAGILTVEGGSVLSSVAGQFEPGWTFAVTIEPAGGSQAPTSDPIIAVTF